jgi:release factor glutamine methyltransferase
MLIRDALICDLERTDAEILLAHVLGKERTWLLTHDDTNLSKKELALWESYAARRRSKEPVAYIIGEKEFYGRRFYTDPSVLIPRPATEILVESALKLLKGETVPTVIEADTDIVIASRIQGDLSHVRCVADIGTGSGCIAVTLACEMQNLRVIATDKSAQALKTAQKNAKRHGVSDRIQFMKGSGMDPLASVDEPFLVVSNPPYILDGTALMKDVEYFEPHSALFGGKNGSDIIGSILHEAQSHQQCRGVVLECKKEQAMMMTDH